MGRETERLQKDGDPDIAALHDAALRLPDEEMRSYEIALAGLRLAVIAEH